MPHLDASALTEDPEGLRFLSRVLDAPVDIDAPFAATPDVEHPVAPVAAPAMPAARVARRSVQPVPEAA